MSDRRTTLAWLVALPLVVGGCAAPPMIGADRAPSAGAPPMRWSGRFAVTMTEPGIELHEERASGRFLLEALPRETRLDLWSPLGQTVASATLAAGSASLVTSEGRRFEADSAEQLTEKVLGWRMPIGDLPRWLRGRLEQPTEVEAGRPLAGVEQGWAVRLDNWRAAGPTRLTLEWPARPDPTRRSVSMKLIVDEVS